MIAMTSSVEHQRLQSLKELSRKAAMNLAGVLTCRIPDDCIDEKRYPLFMARAVLQELIESLQPTTGSAKP